MEKAEQKQQKEKKQNIEINIVLEKKPNLPDVQQKMLSNILYNLSKELGQKKMAIFIKDNTSDLMINKDIVLKVIEKDKLNN